MRSARLRGFTLVEVLVSMAILAVILGVVLGIYDTTSRLTRRSVSRESMWIEARLIAQRVGEALADSVPASDLAAQAGAEANRFDESEAEFYCSDPAPGASLWRVRFANAEAGGGSRVVQARRRARAPQGSETPPKWSAPSDLGLGKGSTDASIRFRVAYAFDNLEPVWAAAPQPGRRPRVVEYTVAVKERNAGGGEAFHNPPVELTGAVALSD